MGLYITEHPYTDFKQLLANIVVPISQASSYLSSARVNMAGIITKVKKIITRSNESMLFVKIEDTSGGLEILVFPRLLKNTADIWEEGKAVFAQGKLSDKDQEIKLLANQALELNLDNIDKVIQKFSQARAVHNLKNNPKNLTDNGSGDQAYSHPLKIIFKKSLNAVNLQTLKNIFARYGGRDKVFFKVRENNQDKIIQTAFQVRNNNLLKEELRDKFKDSIVIAK